MLKVFVRYDESLRAYVAGTIYKGHPKSWVDSDKRRLKMSGIRWLGAAHRYGNLMEISKLEFVEGTPNAESVFLIQEPEPKVRKKRRYQTFAALEPEEAPQPTNIEYIYKEEDGYLKVYRKTLCQSYKISSIA